MNRVALVLLAVLFLFFAATLVLPLTTMGDPVFDIPMLRVRWYGGYGVFFVHAGSILLLPVLVLSANDRWEMFASFAALAGSIGLLVVFVSEEARIIRYGDIIGPYEQARERLAASRGFCFALAGLALMAQFQAVRRQQRAGRA